MNTKWDTGWLSTRILEMLHTHKISAECGSLIMILLLRLYRLNDNYYLPHPQIEFEPEYNSLALSWFDRRKERVLSFCYAGLNIIALSLNAEHAIEIQDPDDNKILDLLRWMGGQYDE